MAIHPSAIDPITTDRTLARVARVLAHGELRQPISVVLRTLLTAAPDVNTTPAITALTDMGCAIDFVHAYAAEPGPSRTGLDYRLKRFGDAFTTYLARTSAWPPLISVVIIGVPQRLAAHVEALLFRSSVELLLAAVDAGSMQAGIVLSVLDNTPLLRIWAADHPWATGEGNHVLDTEVACLRTLGVQVIDRQTHDCLTSELLLIGPGVAALEESGGAI